MRDVPNCVLDMSRSVYQEDELSCCYYREEHPDLVESMAKKGSNVPEKPKTPQQLWYNHEKKAFLKTHPDVSFGFSRQTC